MNNGESNDVNVVLDYFLGKPRHDGPVSFEKAKVAAVRLADRAYKQLMAGSRGVDIAERFDRFAEGARHVPVQIGTHDPEGHRTHTIPGDVCLGCSEPSVGRWVPVSQCPRAMAALDNEDKLGVSIQ